MNFVWWLVDVLAPIAAVKFVWIVFRKLTSKEMMSAMLDKANNGIHDTAENVAKWIKSRPKKRKKKKNDRKCYVAIH